MGCILLCRCINYKSPICPQPLLLNLAIQTIPLKASTNTLSQDSETLDLWRETKFLTTQGLMPHIIISKWFWILNWSSLQKSFWWIETDWSKNWSWQKDAQDCQTQVTSTSLSTNLLLWTESMSSHSKSVICFYDKLSNNSQ